MKNYTIKELHEMQNELVRKCTAENKELTLLSLKAIQQEIDKQIEKGIKYL
ncbi:MAG TPA: hypothetical protein VFC76_00985 [Oscillospiraceae bacterium]|nr:hypothetical protein [Oscillospiraceae bacterium]